MKQILILMTVFVAIACNKNSSNNQTNPVDSTEIIANRIGDTLSEEQLKIIDTMTSIRVPLNTVVLSNGRDLVSFMKEIDSAWYSIYEGNDPYIGKTIFDVKNDINGKLLTVGNYLTNRALFQYSNEGNDKPAQNGLAYSYGSKRYNVRQKPPAGICTDKVYGLDCSGFLYQLFKASNFSMLPLGTAYDQHLLDTIRKTLSEYPSLANINPINLGKLASSKLESGDIIYWSKLGGESTRHIGIILKQANGNLAIYMSNGSSKSNCSKNNSVARGPNTFNLTNTMSYWLNSTTANWEVVRLEAQDVSGIPIINNLKFCDFFPGSGGTTFPKIVNYKACDGNPPYKYKIDNGSWQTSSTFTIYASGVYKFTIRDSQGCEVKENITIN